MKWIKDDEFIRGNTPMTKFNIRILTLGYLSVENQDNLLDIGAGTGSISIEAALHGAKVWSIEKDYDSVQLIRENANKFNVDINIIHGQASKDLPELIFNKCFVGGSGGSLEGIFEYLDTHLAGEGILCGNFILLNNASKFLELLKKHKYKDIETQLIQTSYMDNLGLLRGQNPIFIIKGVKDND